MSERPPAGPRGSAGGPPPNDNLAPAPPASVTAPSPGASPARAHGERAHADRARDEQSLDERALHQRALDQQALDQPALDAGATPEPAFTLRRELWRKALHVSSIAAPLAYAAGLPRDVMIAALAALSAVAVVVEIARARRPTVAAAFERATGPLLRPHERRRWAGATWLLLAFLASVLLFPPAVAIAAMAAVALGDASAALVGRWFGRLRPRGSRKSVEGSLACCLTTFAAAMLLAGLDAGASAAGAVGAAVGEWPERPFDDNMRIALATGGGILLWRLAFS